MFFSENILGFHTDDTATKMKACLGPGTAEHARKWPQRDVLFRRNVVAGPLRLSRRTGGWGAVTVHCGAVRCMGQQDISGACAWGCVVCCVRLCGVCVRDPVRRGGRGRLPHR